MIVLFCSNFMISVLYYLVLLLCNVLLLAFLQTLRLFKIVLWTLVDSIVLVDFTCFAFNYYKTASVFYK